MNDFSPKTNTKLFGHETIEAALLAELAAGTLPHGLLISGPKGIGKATFAYRFARAVLAGKSSGDMDEENPVFRRVAAGSHMDFLVVEPLFDEKKEEFAQDISVEQARGIAQFLSLTPGESEWRVVIVDSIDNLNVNAANAILKILEEPPPQALLMLISHNPGKLLATIRSRCRLVKMAPLAPKDFSRTMLHVLPHVPDDRLVALAELAGFSPGIAQQFEGQGATTLYTHILEILSDLPVLEPAKIHAFADQMMQGKQHANWQLLEALMLRLFERAAKRAAGMAVAPVCDEEPEILARLAAMHGPAVLAAKWQQAASQFSLARRLHLDYKQMIIVLFHDLTEKRVSVGVSAGG